MPVTAPDKVAGAATQVPLCLGRVPVSLRYPLGLVPMKASIPQPKRRRMPFPLRAVRRAVLPKIVVGRVLLVVRPATA